MYCAEHNDFPKSLGTSKTTWFSIFSYFIIIISFLGTCLFSNERVKKRMWFGQVGRWEDLGRIEEGEP